MRGRTAGKRARPVPLTQPLSDHCDSLSERALRGQRSTPQNAGVEVQTEALFGCHYFSSVRPLQGHARLSPQLVEHGRLEERGTECERVAEPLR